MLGLGMRYEAGGKGVLGLGMRYEVRGKEC